MNTNVKCTFSSHLIFSPSFYFRVSANITEDDIWTFNLNAIRIRSVYVLTKRGENRIEAIIYNYTLSITFDKTSARCKIKWSIMSCFRNMLLLNSYKYWGYIKFLPFSMSKYANQDKAFFCPVLSLNCRVMSLLLTRW